MKFVFLLSTLLASHLAFAVAPPADYPIVKGIVRKIDVASSRISIKHEEIPNLNMPPMAMSFLVQDSQMLLSLAAGDKVNFVADDIDGELMVLWIEKAPPVVLASAKILCTGTAPTTPKTNVEIEIRPDKFSTIRYEHAEGPYKGSAHINSIGRMQLHQRNGLHIYRSGVGKLESRLIFKTDKDTISEACFTSFSSGMENSPVRCVFAD